MLGWQIIVTNKDQKIASWRTSISGADWIDDLVKQGLAKKVDSASAYPTIFSVPTKVLNPILINGIPQTGSQFVIGDDYVIAGDKVLGLEIHFDKLNQCLPEDDLLIEAWDLS
jgi:hypothetical protein